MAHDQPKWTKSIGRKTATGSLIRLIDQAAQFSQDALYCKGNAFGIVVLDTVVLFKSIRTQSDVCQFISKTR